MEKLLLLLLAASCAARDLRPPPKLSPPSRLCQDPRLGPRDFCFPAERLEAILDDHPLRVLMVRPPASGTSGSKIMYLEFPDDGLVLKAKWKESKRGGEGLNNEPRKEIAAYQMQKLFLDPQEYVVPPTVGRCIPTELYDAEVSGQQSHPNFAGSQCVFGVVSYWIENVSELGKLSRRRFSDDPAYRERAATLNLFTYLFDHRDTRRSNFVVARGGDPRMFSVDNGLALSGVRNPRAWFVKDWSQIKVPLLPRRLVERLRRVRRAHLDRLAVVAEFHVDGGQLVPIRPGPVIDPERGVRLTGDRLQFGLTRDEIDGIDDRLRTLLERVDAHQIGLFDDGTGPAKAAR